MSGGARLRCVFDCVTLLQAAARPAGPAGGCLKAVFAGDLELHASRATLRELRDVLDYPAVRARFPAITDAAVGRFLEQVAWRAACHRHVPRVIALPRDPRDEPYLDLAVHAGADVLATRDRDLLDLAGGHDEPAKRLRRLAPALRILTPEGLLGEVARPAGT